MTTSAHNNRASLLAGLRTGGVRSTSANIPHTAAPGGSFNVHHFAPTNNPSVFPEEEEDDQVFEMHRQNMFANRAMPMTAAVDGPNNRFSYQQQGQRGMNPNSAPFSPAFQPNMMAQPQLAQTPSMQMQMLQLEMMRIQALQAQQYQAELLAQAQQAQQQQQQQQRRASFNPPATAGPLTNSFDLRAATLSAQMRRANQAGQLGSQLGQGADDHVPMTAALGGRFGSRTVSNNVPSSGRFTTNDYDDIPPTPNSTTVISGGTSLGNPASNNMSNNSNNNNNGPSKSDTASSWRRGGNNNSVLSGNNRIVSSPSVKVTPPNEDQRVSPPLAPSPIATSAPKFRPQPLHFSAAVSQPLPAVAVDHTTDDDTDVETQSQSSTSSGGSNSSPTTPRSSASSNDIPLSPREEASKKLYEGLGIGRPLSAVQSEQSQQQYPTVSVPPHRMVSQPTRQPRGPPSGADELGPKNFATRIRRKAIGGLGMLMGARERREFIEAY